MTDQLTYNGIPLEQVEPLDGDAEPKMYFCKDPTKMSEGQQRLLAYLLLQAESKKT